MAGNGAHWALVALVTWDLAEEDGPYTGEHRNDLIILWSAVARIPDPGGCSSQSERLIVIVVLALIGLFVVLRKIL
jgi:hypothetical protein